jgi:glycerol-3-phosphate dehydrogenase subunit B
VALSADVAIVGGGLAGACAALAAREAGADVLLVARAPGATAVSSGALDFASGAGDVSIAEAARQLAARAEHPYSLFGARLSDAIDAALSFLRKHLAVAGAQKSSDRNLWLATPLGRARPAALAQASIALGDLRALPAGARLGVVALCGPQAVEAQLVAKGLDELLRPESGAVVVAVELYSRREDAQRLLPEIAHDLDKPGRRAQLGEALARAARRDGATHLLAPTVGLDAPAAAQAELSAAAGVPVFEMLGAPPSVPGLRLQRALDAALAAAGVKRVAGIAEKSLSHPLQIIRGAECEPVSCRSVVLASGRFLGGGIRAAPDGALAETALGLPAWAAGRRKLAALMTEELFALRARGPHPGLAAGLRADAELRALDEEGRPAMAAGAKVFAAGAALGGFDPAQLEGGLGVCAVSGLEAGRRAAEAAR